MLLAVGGEAPLGDAARRSSRSCASRGRTGRRRGPAGRRRRAATTRGPSSRKTCPPCRRRGPRSCRRARAGPGSAGSSRSKSIVTLPAASPPSASSFGFSPCPSRPPFSVRRLRPSPRPSSPSAFSSSLSGASGEGGPCAGRRVDARGSPGGSCPPCRASEATGPTSVLAVK